MMNQKPKIIIIVGPTASGKSGLAIKIAKKYSGEIISADSRQIYKKLDIGTAKVTKEEQEEVPHHLIDIIDIEEKYSSAQFKKDAQKSINEIIKRGNTPIIAGGTFFYVDTLLERISTPKVPPNEKLRTELEQLSNTELFEKLSIKDPLRAEVIDRHNKRRLVRALEIVEALGAVPTHDETELPYATFLLGIRTDKDELRARMKERGETWLTGGFIEETEGLLQSGVSRKRLQEIGFEYQLCVDLIDDKITKDEFLTRFEQKNWQYAKRQLTWLKRDKSILWISLSEQREIDLLVKQFLLN